MHWSYIISFLQTKEHVEFHIKPGTRENTGALFFCCRVNCDVEQENHGTCRVPDLQLACVRKAVSSALTAAL
jgi:hypothetical protein